jgi:hypothetical protein
MIIRQSREHLRCSLRVTKVRNLIITGSCSHEVDLGRGIVLTQLKETIVEESLLVFGRVQLSVRAAVFVASVVAEPDIVTSISEDVSQRRCSADAPGISIGEKTMLEENWLSSTSASFHSESEHLELIAIFRHYLITISHKSIFSSQLLKSVD